MSWGAIVVGVAGAVYSGYQANKNREQAEGQYEEMKTLQTEQQAKLDAQKEEYKQMEFKNPYAQMTNRFADMENVFEDLTVNQQEAQFQAQQGAQQRANIMQSMRGAAGSSGIAGLAQALANQGALQTQRISASIGAQEARNQALAAKGASSIQTLERQGAAQVDLAKMGGEQFVQQAEMDRQATLLGMQMGEATGANQAAMQAQANQMNAQIAQQQATMDAISTVGTAAGEIDWSKQQ
tara:strand:+ start:17 stop:733 length:717 start_codon:yes stop_codon:yes gene_type:complete